jgi:5-oxoprolinase (ATP-hydrolysing) subunit A
VHVLTTVYARAPIRPIPTAQTLDGARSRSRRWISLARCKRSAPRSCKSQGALYHDANRSPSLARLCLDAAGALGRVSIVGPALGAWPDEARARGLDYLVEAFADRGVASDGTLIPRGEPGALITDPHRCAARALELAQQGIGTLCIHGDTENALAIAQAVSDALQTHANSRS